MGSCFAAHLGKRLAHYQFPTLLNPFGILYNPSSIAKQLQRAVDLNYYQTAELFEHQGRWHHFLFHSQFSGDNPDLTLSNMNQQLKETHDYLKNCKQIFITLGSAYVYFDKISEQVVGNCHKLPARFFDKKQLTVADCTKDLSACFENIKAFNPECNIILTVSPVRHVRDGLMNNQLSKSALRLACENLTQQYDYAYYFPAFEIVMDDLRDYRFYELDMIHPNKTAIDYIWSHFKHSLFSEQTTILLEKAEKIIQASQHRPFQVASKNHQAFLQKQLEEIAALNNAFPFMKFEKERAIFEKQLL